jgi:hypothetical protein
MHTERAANQAKVLQIEHRLQAAQEAAHVSSVAHLIS